MLVPIRTQVMGTTTMHNASNSYLKRPEFAFFEIGRSRAGNTSTHTDSSYGNYTAMHNAYESDEITIVLATGHFDS